LEYLSVLKLKKSAKGPILCFVGPPGVGKTSLGRSIARALGRKFVRISLAGVRGVAEIRGHRRTYIGALPGKIIQCIKQAGSNYPVFVLDEVDKLGIDFRGDPSSALLEVLDPEQNHAFVDHYLGVPFDLSKVMFICTANIMDTIPSPLLDRMEVIEIPGYTEEDKVAIAKRYLIPRQREANGLNEKDISFSDEAIRKIIRLYTREAGLRNLEREIGSICRKVARRIAEGEEGPFKITAKSVGRYLGSPRHHPETETMKEEEVGVAIGLAWTPTGGDIIHVEATVMPGKGKLTLTGQLGDVMKESAMAAVDYIRTRAQQLGIPSDFYYKHDFHIHVPAGAIPKDGPSAGITLAIALISALTKIPTRKDVAMTGEITLTGRVLPIGGLREKSLAAKRAGIRKVIIPRKNLVDLTDMPEEVKKSITFLPVEHMDQVVELALQENPMKEVPAFERENH
ncbi:MAG: endopeptidase La, partial [Aquificota bacterium]